ncbi:MAG: glycosyltransferase family 2 protein [Actinomycetota bacterium]|nr:glycosyltransferase family 2 protein [Actinomycetota bacterium]
MKQPPQATLIIVAYGRHALVTALLDSIAEHTLEPHEILVIDNDSPDSTAALLKKHPSQPRVVEASRNLGYGGGVNLGVREATAEVAVIMNSDLQVTPNWLPPLLTAIETRTATIAAPLYLDTNGNVIESGACITADGHIHSSQIPDSGFKPVDHVSAACWAFEKHWFESVGGFDPTYGLGYYEDVDLVNVARLHNNRIVVVNDSKIIHHTGGTFGSVASQHLSHRNHARSETRWHWMYRGTATTPWDGETAVTHGRVAVIGHHPDIVSKLREQNISVVTLNDVNTLRQRAHRDDVVVTQDEHAQAQQIAPRAQITDPQGLQEALKLAGITPSSTPPRSRFHSITATRSRRW